MKINYFILLTKETSLQVRKQCIQIFPEIVKFIGKSSAIEQIKSPIHELLSQKEYSIVYETLNSIPYILDYLSPEPPETQIEETLVYYDRSCEGKFQFFIIDLISIIEFNNQQPTWRLSQIALKIIKEKMTYFEIQFLQDKLFNVLVDTLKSGNSLLRKSAGECYIELL